MGRAEQGGRGEHPQGPAQRGSRACALLEPEVQVRLRPMEPRKGGQATKAETGGAWGSPRKQLEAERARARGAAGVAVDREEGQGAEGRAAPHTFRGVELLA